MVLFKTVIRGCKVRNFGLEQSSVHALQLRRNQWTIRSAPLKRQASQFKIDGLDVIICSFCVCCELSAVTRRECANVRTVTNKVVLKASLYPSCPVGYRRHRATSCRLHYSGKFERFQDSNDIAFSSTHARLIWNSQAKINCVHNSSRRVILACGTSSYNVDTRCSDAIAVSVPCSESAPAYRCRQHRGRKIHGWSVLMMAVFGLIIVRNRVKPCWLFLESRNMPASCTDTSRYTPYPALITIKKANRIVTCPCLCTLIICTCWADALHADRRTSSLNFNSWELVAQRTPL
jgi:hypothetical protein